MIRIRRPGQLIIQDMVVRNWFLEGDDEILYGDLNDPTSHAGMILLAAIFVHMAGYAGLTLESKWPTGEDFESSRLALDVIRKAQRPEPRLTLRRRLRAWLIRRLAGTD